MFLGDSWLFWLFATLWVMSIGGFLVLLERIRQQVNRVLPDGKKANLDSWPRSTKEFFLGTHIWSYISKLLEQHRKYYPTSFLRRALIIALVSIVPSFIGFALSGR